MANTEYTQKQLSIISGEVPLESMNGRALSWFYKKALARNDSEWGNKIADRLSVLKAEAYERTKQRSRNRADKIRRKEEIQWQQPKSNIYTDHQIKVIRGEVPYEDVHTKELIHIHLKAHNNGDYELSERFFDLVSERRMRKIQYRLKHNKARKISKKLDSFIGPNIDLPLTHFDKAVLMSDDELDKLSEDRLKKTLDSLKQQGDEETFHIVEFLLSYKKDPYSFCIVKEHWEAIDLIEALLQLPIRRPETWFYQEDTKTEDG